MNRVFSMVFMQYHFDPFVGEPWDFRWWLVRRCWRKGRDWASDHVKNVRESSNELFFHQWWFRGSFFDAFTRIRFLIDLRISQLPSALPNTLNPNVYNLGNLGMWELIPKSGIPRFQHTYRNIEVHMPKLGVDMSDVWHVLVRVFHFVAVVLIRWWIPGIYLFTNCINRLTNGIY